MTDIQMVKLPGGMFRPANTCDAESVETIQNGSVVNVKITQPRNPAFHRKFFAMLNFAYEYWDPSCPEIAGGIKPEKSFDRFRKDILIMAGFRTVVVNIKGEARYEAESISFGKMDETRFNEVYRQVFDVVWRLVLSTVRGMTEAEAESAINQMLSYD